MWFMRLSSEDLGQDSINTGKEFSLDFINELKLNKSYIWQTMEFDEFFITSILSGLMIEELNYMVTIPRGSFFYSTRLLLHAAKCDW